MYCDQSEIKNCGVSEEIFQHEAVCILNCYFGYSSAYLFWLNNKWDESNKKIIEDNKQFHGDLDL